MRTGVYVIPFFICSLVASGEITFTFDYPLDGVEMTTFEGYDIPLIENGLVTFDERCPNLPGIPYSFLIPQGTVLEDVTVEIIEIREIDGNWNIDPVRYFALNREPGPRIFDDRIYNSDDLFPSETAIAIQTGSKTGFRVGSFTFVPFRYKPLSGQLSIITSASITLTYVESSSVERLCLTDRQVSIAESGLSNILFNPEMLDEWAPAIRIGGGTDGANWIVIGDPAWETIFQPLVDHRISTAGSAEFVSLDWIYSNYSGYDTQEQIRNYLIDMFQNQGLVYTLIVGDYGETTRISHLSTYGEILNSTTDLYYSDLDGTWDGDGDHLYGESNDGIDYYSDIYVGRFSSDIESRLQTMIDKTIAYETSPTPGSWQTTAVFPAGGLWPEYNYWGSFVSDSIIKRIPVSWTIHKLYETAASHPTNQIELLNDGASFCEPTGHGYERGIYWYYNPPKDIISNSNYTSLTNIDKLTVMTSIACLSGKISYNGSIAERLMFSATGGAIAVMFNSDYGWGTPPSMGPSEHLEIHISNQLWTYNQNEIGVTLALAKDAFKAAGGMIFQNWVLQEHNLLGDPALLFVAGQLGIEGGSDIDPPVPSLSAPWPNPSSGYCSIAYDMPFSCNANITVYDLTGRAVRTMFSGTLAAGQGSMLFDGRDSSGSQLPSGCYSIVLTGPSSSAFSRMIIAR